MMLTFLVLLFALGSDLKVEEGYVPYGSGREWATILPNARLITVPDAAHQCWVDAPDVVLPAIEEFLSGRWPEKAQKIESRD
jgi:pimeloyl-ACP methyl ester carboxylesterase